MRTKSNDKCGGRRPCFSQAGIGSLKLLIEFLCKWDKSTSNIISEVEGISDQIGIETLYDQSVLLVLEGSSDVNLAGESDKVGTSVGRKFAQTSVKLLKTKVGI